MRLKMSKQPPPAPTGRTIGPCPTVIKIVGRPGTGSLPSTIRPPLALGAGGGCFDFSWLVVLGLTALLNSISVYIRPSPKESERRDKR